MDGVRVMCMEQVMTEQLVASIHLWDVKVKAMKSKTKNSIITPEELSQKFNIGFDKANYMFIVTT